MYKKFRELLRKKGNQQGFTLVELIIVMAILAVLAGIAVPKFGSVLNDSKKNADAANVKLLQDAVELYYNQEGSYPAGLSDLSPKYVRDIPTQKYPKASEGNSFSYDQTTGKVSDPSIGS